MTSRNASCRHLKWLQQEQQEHAIRSVQTDIFQSERLITARKSQEENLETIPEEDNRDNNNGRQISTSENLDTLPADNQETPSNYKLPISLDYFGSREKF